VDEVSGDQQSLLRALIGNAAIIAFADLNRWKFPRRVINANGLD
jgi:hypothetical protein